MAIETICSGCGKRLGVSDEHAGKRARCPACGQIYTVPYPAEPKDLDEAAENRPATDSGLAETVGVPETASQVDPSTAAFSPPDEFWMETADGAIYGPVERAKLNRWFSEGRVGPNYQIRVGQNGSWQPAEIFDPTNPGSSHPRNFAAHEQTSSSQSAPNPYADSSSPYRPTQPGPQSQFPKRDPSGWVLSMGILSWVSLLFCPLINVIPGLVAWISGSSALKDIQAGLADPTNRPLVQVGYYLGMINVLLTLFGLVGSFAALILGLAAGGF